MSYNSYKSSPSYGSPGVSRGRGYSPRGSYRGRGVDSSSSWGSGSTSRGRGYSGPSRGRFNVYKEHSSGSSYDTRSRYTSGSSGVERYSSRGRGEDTGYRRYSRADTGEYSSPRDHREHRSPDSQRKRMRTDHGYVQASSTRRSHEGGYGGVTDYSSRYSYSEDKGSYGDERAYAYRDDRRSTGTYRPREEYPRRKSEVMESSMPPPSSIPPRHVSSPRGSFRGRLSSRGARGMSRMFLAKRTNTILARKRSLADSYMVRKRILTARTQADTLRRLRMIKLRRLREAAANKAGVSKKGVKDDSSKATEDISDEEEDEKMDDDDEEELEEGETPDKKETPKKTKAGKDEEPEEGEDVDEDEEEEVDEEGKKTETKPNGNVHITIKQDSDARAVSEESPTVRRTFTGKPFIKLLCPHCSAQCVTFQEYTVHLHSSRHISAMRKQSLRLKQTLADMRMNQREKQRVVEENDEAGDTLTVRSKFCHICKLNYKQLKSIHVTSEYHREMKKFLMPICFTCQLEFKSPMLYENHLCSLEHIKRQATRAERQKRQAERLKAEQENSGAEDDDEKDLNLDNFMILDSVGDVDDTANDAEDGEGKSDKEKKEGEEKKKENLGSEHVKTVEVYFCELCSHYLPRSENPDKVLANHCRSRPHLQRYVRHRDDELLRKEAERIHRKRLAKKNAAKEAEAKKARGDNKDEKMDVDKAESNEKIGTKTSEDSAGDSPKKKKEAGESRSVNVSSDTIGESRDLDLERDLEAGMDDKLWADVDKDLGELLREVEPGNKSSDEDDDSHAEGGRYDRFRYSEKGSAAVADPSSEGDAVKAGEGTAEADAEDDKDVAKPAESKGETDVPVKKTSVATPSTPVAAVN